jgi:hypothetical protein
VSLAGAPGSGHTSRMARTDVDRSLAPGMRVVIGLMLAILALTLVGVAGILVLVHRSGGTASPAVATVATPATTAAPATAEATQAMAPPAPAATLAKVRIDTDPDMATIQEDGVSLCESTPCEIRYTGADADPSRSHVLAIARPGYVPQTLTVKPGDSPLMVKLARVRAAPTRRPRPSDDDRGYQPRF